MNVKFVDLYQEYGVQKENWQKGILDCYIQKTDMEISPKRLRPAILILPGGGYGHVSAREGEPVALRFLARGYSAFVLRYSVAPAKFPVALREAAMAMRYLRQHAAEFEIDPGMIGAMGFSAGGHLCGTLGMMYDCPEVADIGPATLLRPDALGLCYPVTVSWGNTHGGSFDNLCGEDTALRQRMSLERQVRGDMPPVFLWHTRDDGCVPCRNSLVLADALEKAGVDFVLHLYHSGAHGLSTVDTQVYPAGSVPKVSADVSGWVDAMLDFFDEIGLRCTDGAACL